MTNRKRYYNSFFDQIHEYKQQSKDHREDSKYIHHHVLGAGLMGGLMVAAIAAGVITTFQLPQTRQVAQSVIRVEERPAFDFFNQLTDADSSFASENDPTRTRPYEDTYVNSTAGQMNFGSSEALQSGGAARARAYLRFDLSELASKEDLVLKLYPQAAFNGTIQVYRLKSDTLWESDTLTYESAPEIGEGTVLARSSGNFAPGVSVDFDLRDAFLADSIADLMVVTTGGQNPFVFYARESGSSPELTSVR